MIRIEFLSLVVRRSALDRVYRDGSSGFIRDHAHFDDRINTYDEALIKFGAMSPHDIHKIAQKMESLGLTGIVDLDGEQHWCDFCVVDELMGPSLKCDWIQYETKTRTALCV